MVNTERIGKWLAADGTVIVPDPTNLHRYVMDAPTDGTDPSGLGEAAKENHLGPKPQALADGFLASTSASDPLSKAMLMAAAQDKAKEAGVQNHAAWKQITGDAPEQTAPLQPEARFARGVGGDLADLDGLLPPDAAFPEGVLIRVAGVDDVRMPLEVKPHGEEKDPFGLDALRPLRGKDLFNPEQIAAQFKRQSRTLSANAGTMFGLALLVNGKVVVVRDGGQVGDGEGTRPPLTAFGANLVTANNARLLYERRVADQAWDYFNQAKDHWNDLDKLKQIAEAKNNPRNALRARFRTRGVSGHLMTAVEMGKRGAADMPSVEWLVAKYTRDVTKANATLPKEAVEKIVYRKIITSGLPDKLRTAVDAVDTVPAELLAAKKIPNSCFPKLQESAQQYKQWASNYTGNGVAGKSAGTPQFGKLARVGKVLGWVAIGADGGLVLYEASQAPTLRDARRVASRGVGRMAMSGSAGVAAAWAGSKAVFLTAAALGVAVPGIGWIIAAGVVSIAAAGAAGYYMSGVGEEAGEAVGDALFGK